MLTENHRLRGGKVRYGFYRVATINAREAGKVFRMNCSAGLETLPPLLRLESGRPVTSAEEWQQRRHELLALATQHVYGALPLQPAITRGVLLHETAHRRVPGAKIQTWRVLADDASAFHLRLLLPPGELPCPVLVSGDACWGYATDAVQQRALRQGVALALFNRVEVMSDVPGDASKQVCCAALHHYQGAAIAAWAWAYLRAVDVLISHPQIDGRKIAITGHSRGGKAALLAGALGENIGLTHANNSGAGGAGCWRVLGPGAETLADITARFPAWFSPGLARFAGRENELPFDQHMLKALLAPRYLLTTEASGDRWANPQGTQVTHTAAQEAYRLLGVPERLAMTVRRGGHAFTPHDWATVLAGMEQAFGSDHRGGAV